MCTRPRSQTGNTKDELAADAARAPQTEPWQATRLMRALKVGSVNCLVDGAVAEVRVVLVFKGRIVEMLQGGCDDAV